MSRSFPFARLGLLLLLLLAVPAAAHEELPQFARIDEALAAGRIDADQSLFHRFQYVFDGDKLPAEFVPAERAPLRCATPLIIEYNRMRDQLRPETVAAIEAWLAPPAGDKLTYISPSGRFQLTFVTSGGNGVPPADTNPANGVPDYIERIASYLDTSWATEITQWGFTAPLTSPYYNIGFSNQSAYGYTTVTGSTTRIVLENDYAGFPPNDDPDGDAPRQGRRPHQGRLRQRQGRPRGENDRAEIKISSLVARRARRPGGAHRRRRPRRRQRRRRRAFLQ